MLSRLLDPSKGTLRDRVLQLMLMAVVAAQLMAFYSLCQQQVRKAEERQAAARMERVARNECLQSLAGTFSSCSPSRAAPMEAHMMGAAGGRADSGVPAAYIFR